MWSTSIWVARAINSNVGVARHAAARSALRPSAADFNDFDRAAADVLATLRTQRRAFEQVHGVLYIDYLQHAIGDLRASGTALYHRERADRATAFTEEARDRNQWNERDARMADNLRWLIQERYAGRKVIVWAHNAHVMKSYFASNWAGVYTTLPRDGLKPAGAWTAEWLKDGLYSIALTTFEGEENWTNFQMHGAIAPAPEGSLEWRLHQLGMPQLFLDLRPAARDRGQPLHTPLSLRVSGYGKPTSDYGHDVLPDVTKAFDAILFIDHMTPATPLQARP